VVSPLGPRPPPAAGSTSLTRLAERPHDGVVTRALDAFVASTRAKPGSTLFAQPRKTLLDGFGAPAAFGERDPIAAEDVPPAAAWRGRMRAIEALRGNGQSHHGHLLNGKSGRLQCARFLDRDQRLLAGADLHRVSDGFWRWAAAEERLREVLPERFDEKVVRKFHAWMGQHDRRRDPVHEDGSDAAERGSPRAPMNASVSDEAASSSKVDAVATRKACRSLRRALAQDLDPFLAAARFHNALVRAGVSTRAARLLADRVLTSRDILPPIYEDFSPRDDETLARAMSEGAVRMARQLGHGPVRIGDRFAWPDAWLVQLTAERVKDPGSAFGFGRLILSTSQPKVGSADPNPPSFEVSHEPVKVGGRSFLLAPDGFAYDALGRPHLVTAHGELELISQRFFYLLMRRVAFAAKPAEMLERVTRATREGLERHASSASLRLTPERERSALAADAALELHLPALPREQLLSLFDLTRVGGTRLFYPSRNSSQNATKASFTLSAFTQHDLDLWQAQQAFVAAGDVDGVTQLHTARRALFGLAQHRLLELGKSRRTDDNPLGLQQAFEREMLATSPLRFPSYEQALAHGDETLTVWQGGSPAIGLLGLHPNDLPGQPDAREVSAQLHRRGAARSLFESLKDLSTQALGRPEICTTSDLSLLAVEGGFADRSAQGSLQLGALPGWIQRTLAEALEPHGAQLGLRSTADLLRAAAGTLSVTAPAEVDLAGLTPAEIRRALADLTLLPEHPSEDPRRAADLRERMDRIKATLLDCLCLAASDAPNLLQRAVAVLTGDRRPFDLAMLLEGVHPHSIKSVRDRLHSLGDLVTLSRGEAPGLIRAELNRRAYALEIPKRAALPSISFGGGRYEQEQEIHLLERVWGHGVRRSYTREGLLTPA
jgi:hypothetical protein